MVSVLPIPPPISTDSLSVPATDSDSPTDDSLKSPRWVRLSVSLFSQHVDVVETQMFATFIDNKIVSQWQDPDHSVKVFDMRNNAKGAEEDGDDHQKAVYEKLNNMDDIGKLDIMSL